MKKNILLISLISLLFISCENALNIFERTPETTTPTTTTLPSPDGKTYITLGNVQVENDARTINPTYSVEALTSLYLYGTKTAEQKDPSGSDGHTITSASSVSELISKLSSISDITPDFWDFKLKAKFYDFNYSGQITTEIKAAQTNSLNFTLVPDSMSYPYGVLDFTVNFTGNADKVVTTVKEKSTSETAKFTKTFTAGNSTTPITTVEGQSYRKINLVSAKSSSSAEKLTTGKYYVCLDFYQTGTDSPINTIENIVRIENYVTTKATLNLSLDSLYSATYKFYKEDDGSNTELAVADGESLPDGVDFVISNSVLSDKISTKSTLPNLTYPGYTFAGWYKATPFTAENKITSIPGDLSSSPTLYAYFTSVTTSPDLYVNSSADPDLADGSQSHPYASISAALERIENLDNATDYTIIVDGEYVSSESTRIEITKATSLTITGKTGNAADSLDAQSEGIPLIINTAVPVTVKNIKITNGSPYGIQLLSGKLTLEENTLISENKTGVLISGGEVIMTDGEISSNTADYGAGVYITYDDLNKTLGKFTMSGGTISGNTAQYGCGGGVLVDGTLYAEPEELAEYTGGDGDGHVLFTMSNGTISGNEENSTVTDDYEVGVGGGGVCVAGQYAKFVMSDSAVIKANTAPAYGAGVSVWNGAQFIMNGGTIGGSSPDDGNITGEEVEISTFGGGVYLGGDESSSFTMNNGTISNNKALGLGAKPFGYDTPSNCGGAGVGIFYGTFTMVNGNITSNNSKRHGGGVYIAGHGIFDMQGGSISGNTCTDNGKAINQNWVSNSGVTYYGQLKMKGNAVVTSNNDVYLCDKLTITGSLSGTSPVATLTPSSYTITSNSEPLIEVTTDSETSIGSEYNKFAITPDSGNNYELSNEGKLVASSNGGGDPSTWTGSADGHDYVDLGLSSGTLWATMNVGATVENRYYGDYFAWGETEPRYTSYTISRTDDGYGGISEDITVTWKTGYEEDGYKWNNYFDGTNGENFTIFKDADSSELDATHDAATVNWGANWKTPTKDQCSELINSCFMTSTDDYKNTGIAGIIVYKATAGDEGKDTFGATPPDLYGTYSLSTPHIFFPLCGRFPENNFVSSNNLCAYLWSSTLEPSYPGTAYQFSPFNTESYEPVEFDPRANGEPIRPIYVGSTGGSGGNGGNSSTGFTTIAGKTISHVAGSNENAGDYPNVNIPSLDVANSLVTQTEYEKYMTYYSSYTPQETGTAKDTTPAYYVSWIDAIIYCNLRSMAENKTPVYALGGKTDPASDTWIANGVTKVTVNEKDLYYYNSTENDDSFDTDTEYFTFNLDADGYRLMTGDECYYICDNYSSLFAGSTMNEWTQTYNAETAYRLYYSYSDKTCIDKAKGNATREATLGFRVVRNAQ